MNPKTWVALMGFIKELQNYKEPQQASKRIKTKRGAWIFSGSSDPSNDAIVLRIRGDAK